MRLALTRLHPPPWAFLLGTSQNLADASFFPVRADSSGMLFVDAFRVRFAFCGHPHLLPIST